MIYPPMIIVILIQTGLLFVFFLLIIILVHLIINFVFPSCDSGGVGLREPFLLTKCKLQKTGLSKPRVNEGQLYWKLIFSYLILSCQNSLAMVTSMLTYA